MIDQGHGLVVNMTSRWATATEQEMGPYCATKAAVAALTRALAEELTPFGVKAVALNPGNVLTDMLRNYLKNDADRLRRNKYPSPDQWARIAVAKILTVAGQDSQGVCDISLHPPLETTKT
jgi:NAD(P)-dependent dehydrogenase (short-subunit alcohol dehydrogenase family)